MSIRWSTGESLLRHVCVRIGLCSNVVASHTGEFSIQRGNRTGAGDSHGIVGGIGFGTAYIEFKKPGHHNDCLRAAAVFAQGESRRLSAAHKKPAKQARLIAHHPSSTLVPADEQERRSRAGFRILAVSGVYAQHSISPSDGRNLLAAT